MKLLSQPASPFVAKCRMAAAHLGLDVEAVVVDANAQAPELLEANPLGKIPCLVDGEEAIYDSRVIVRYLNDKAKGSLYKHASRPRAPERMEALCDGICDAAVGYQYEMRFRPEEKWERSWLDRLKGKFLRGLEEAERHLPPKGTELHVGSIALFATLGYLDLRYPGEWQKDRGDLLHWQQEFEERHEALAALTPSA